MTDRKFAKFVEACQTDWQSEKFVKQKTAQLWMDRL